MSAQLLMKLGEGRASTRSLAQLRHERVQESLTALETAQAAVEAAQQKVMRTAGEYARTGLQIAAEVFALWADCCRTVIEGDTPEIQGVRSEILAFVRENARTLQETLHDLQEVEKNLRVSFEEEAPLLRALAELDRLQKRFLARWQTADDLEDLVAEWSAPSAKDFQAVAKKFGPPTAWFEHGGEPPTD